MSDEADLFAGLVKATVEDSAEVLGALEETVPLKPWRDAQLQDPEFRAGFHREKLKMDAEDAGESVTGYVLHVDTGDFLELVQRHVDEKWAPEGRGGKVTKIVVIDDAERHHVLHPLERPGVRLIAVVGVRAEGEADASGGSGGEGGPGAGPGAGGVPPDAVEA